MPKYKYIINCNVATDCTKVNKAYSLWETNYTKSIMPKNTNMIFFLNLRTIHLFQLSQLIKTWIMQPNFSIDLYLFLKSHSSTGTFFTCFADQLPDFSIGGALGWRLVEISNSFFEMRFEI